MANLRDIRNRISSIENTQQITKAMKMVAAAKLRKAQQRIIATRPYAKKMRSVVSRLINGVESDNPILRNPEDVDSILIIIVGSDRGLCGGFNNNLFKMVEQRISDDFSDYYDQNKLDLITIGRKADGFFKKRKYNVVDSYVGFFDDLNYETTSSIMSETTEKFVKGDYDKVLVAFNEFKSVISQNRLIDEILPLKTDQFEEESSSNLNEIDYIYEPDDKAILDELLPVHLNMQLWRAVLESNASEQGARMTAMDSATENAKEIKDELKLKYNQARQSAITTEISEIVSGAAALEDA
jgi:F-type H+-transporting ATPase subunit gamma